MKRPTLADLPAACLARNRELLIGGPRPKPRPAAVLAPARPIRRPTLRQKSGDGLNRWEREFLAFLAANYAGRINLAQSITLKLANGVRYTPDFMTVTQHALDDVTLSAYEVKGFMRDDAAVKIKVAAAVYPWIAFYLATRPRGASEWRIERVYANQPAPLPRAPLAPQLRPQD